MASSKKKDGKAVRTAEEHRTRGRLHRTYRTQPWTVAGDGDREIPFTEVNSTTGGDLQLCDVAAALHKLILSAVDLDHAWGSSCAPVRDVRWRKAARCYLLFST